MSESEKVKELVSEYRKVERKYKALALQRKDIRNKLIELLPKIGGKYEDELGYAIFIDKSSKIKYDARKMVLEAAKDKLIAEALSKLESFKSISTISESVRVK